MRWLKHLSIAAAYVGITMAAFVVLFLLCSLIWLFAYSGLNTNLVFALYWLVITLFLLVPGSVLNRITARWLTQKELRVGRFSRQFLRANLKALLVAIPIFYGAFIAGIMGRILLDPQALDAATRSRGVWSALPYIPDWYYLTWFIASSVAGCLVNVVVFARLYGSGGDKTTS